MAGPVQVRPISPPPPASTAPASLPSAPVPKKKGPPGLKPEEVGKTRKFHEIADNSDEEEEDEEEDEDEDLGVDVQYPTRPFNHPACERCWKARRTCERAPNGGSCLPCKVKKYKCEYAWTEPVVVGKRGRITKEEYVEEESEEELAPPPAKKRATKKKAEPVRVKAEPERVKKEPKGKKAAKPRVATKKGKARQRDLEEEVQEIMVVDDEEEEEEGKERERKPRAKLNPGPTRTYTNRGRYNNFFLILHLTDF